MQEEDIPPALCAGYCTSRLFSLSKSEVRASWLVPVPGQLQEEVGRGHADQREMCWDQQRLNTLRKYEN